MAQILPLNKFMSLSDIKYRPNVAGILRNPRGEILICERVSMAGAWQFPQGGIDKGETPEEALVRELGEEISVRRQDIQILERRGPYRYLFGGGPNKRGFHGNEQLYFLVDFIGNPSRIDLATAKPEFRAHRWILPKDFRLQWLPEMKREVYRTVFREFFGIKI
jgi:putative (di)nucleoside polyphosphate hydrolase